MIQSIELVKITPTMAAGMHRVEKEALIKLYSGYEDLISIEGFSGFAATEMERVRRNLINLRRDYNLP